MIFIKHRVNTVKDLLNTPESYGVEVDLRAFEKKITLNHEPFDSGESFEKWIKYYKHAFLVLNLKECGIEYRVIDILKKYNINNYFFLDLPFPSSFKLSQFTNNISSRFSYYEDFTSVMNTSKIFSWVWVDFYNSFPLTYLLWKELENKKIKICIVSPELQGLDPYLEIPKLRKLLIDEKIIIDAVCSKHPELWID
jgi:hypothetical protein